MENKVRIYSVEQDLRIEKSILKCVVVLRLENQACEGENNEQV